MSGQATHLLHGRDVSFPVLKRGLLEIAHSLYSAGCSCPRRQRLRASRRRPLLDDSDGVQQAGPR